MTFVRTKLFLERLKDGETLQIRLKGHEPLINVPKSILELGHDILDLHAESSDNLSDAHVLTIRKKN